MFDVIIPTYNSNPEYLRLAVDSVLQQTFPDFKIYICDGTPDRLPHTAQESLKDYTDERLTILKQSGIGPSNARNEALQAGNNPYVALIDGDDLWVERKLEYLAGFIKNYRPQMIWSAMKMGLDKNTNHLFRTGYFENLERTAFEHRWFKVFWCPLATSSIVFERNALESIGAWDEKKFMGEDTDLNVRMLQNFALDSYQINAYMGLYRQHPSQTTLNEEHYHENMNAGLEWADRTKLFDETFVELKANTKGKYTHDYWNTLYEDVQNHRIHAHNPNETDFKNYIMMRVDRIPNGTKFVQDTPELETLMEGENV
tara:strand:+ start:185 stop:1126 length:942 start_codon:yes stop_codon:yes gene_type:complete